MKNLHFYILLFLIIFSGACLTRTKIPPVVPSKESVSFNFSFFEQNYKENTHYSFVSEKVLEWKAFLEDSIAIHQAIIENALQTDFDFQKEKTWLSSFSFNIGTSDMYSAKFFGTTDADTVLYKTFLSYDTISEIIYLDGTAYEDAKIGEWILNKSKVDEYEYVSSKIMSISWDFSDNKHIKFVNNQAGSYNLNYIYYVDSVDNEYDAYLDVYDKGNENHSFIQWNKTQNNGRVKDNLRFSNDEWHYWDIDFQDIN